MKQEELFSCEPMSKKVDLVARVEEMAAKAKKKLAPPENSKNTNVVQLPLWPDEVRAIPNGFLRSALFGVIKAGARQYMKSELIAAVDGVEIRYTGERLDQGDLDTFETVLHAVRLQNLGNKCRVTSYSLLKLLGQSHCGKNRATLHSRITRLVANAIELKTGRYSYIGSLIADAAKDEENQEWVIELNPKLRSLFAADQFTNVDWKIRNSLNGKPLAQWLHGFYASHAAPFPFRIETLHKLCGSEATVMSDFTKTLRKALDAVKAASDGFDYEIQNGLVQIKKKATNTQKKHLLKKTITKKKQ